MAQQVPSGTRFIGIATSVDLVERKSSVLNKQTEPYTIEDIILSVPAGPAGPQGVQGPAGPIGPVGPAGLNWQGAWVSGTSYVADDAVGYNGASWFCILATSGTTTPNLDTTHWALLASQGAQGIQGVQGATGPQGPAGNPATQTLQQTVDLGNTITASGYETIITAGSIAVGTVGFGYTLLNPDYFQLNNGSNYINLNLPDVLTGNRTIKFPDAAGTIALTSDVTLQKAVTGGNNFVSGFSKITLTGIITVENTSLLTKSTLEHNKLSFTSNVSGLKTTNLRQSLTPTVNRTIYLPDADGTIALTSDISLQKAFDAGRTMTTDNFTIGVFDAASGLSVKNTSSSDEIVVETTKITLTKNSSGLKTTNLRQAVTPTANRTITLPDADGTISLQNYKSYVALISQSGTSAPTATVVFNDTAATFTWSYDDVGSYFVTCSSPILLSGKTVVFVTTQGNAGNGQNKIFGGTRTNDSNVSLNTSSNGILDLNLEIRIYA
jgi:hypothetical protein